MANTIFNAFIKGLFSNTIDLDTAVLRCYLVDSTSTYTPDKSHTNLGAMTGLVELAGASGYSRKTLTTPLVTQDDANARVEYDADNIDFGALGTGGIIKALLIYVQTGGNDSTPNDDIPVAYIDTVSGSPALPLTTNGGTVVFNINAEGLLQGAQA